VDHYCIDQGDVSDVEKQVQNMDVVCECANMTKVALCGPSIEFGLPGISRPMAHTSQPVVKIEQGQLMATFVESMWDHQGTRPGDKRALTLQEGILSKRCIFFDRSHVYMRCR
jgi:hypothetical protein